MKRFALNLVFVLFVSMIFSSFILAYECNDDQIIMKLYSETNSHGALWNDSSLSPEDYTKICFDEIFGYNYTGINPHQDNGNNVVLKLSSDANAHAEGPLGTNYNYKVNYGDLNCRIVSSTTVKEPAEEEIVSLSESTNAHIGVAGNYSESGNYKILCSGGVSSSNIGEVYWSDGLGNRINQSCVNNTVYMNAVISGTNEEVIFEIYESDLLLNDKIRTKSDGSQLNGTTDGSGKLMIPWKITNSDLSNAGLGSPYEFYFNASNDVSSNASVAPHLDVLTDGCLNKRPVAKISAPKHRQIYFVGTEIEFNETSYDVDGSIVEYLWNVTFNGVQEFTSSERKFLHNFDVLNMGQRTINLKVTDDKGYSSQDEVAILITGSPGILAYINQPKYSEVINGDERLSVTYSASDSYVINNNLNSECVGEVQCLAGNCPPETMNSLSSCASSRIPVSGGPKGFESLNFSWDFVDLGWKFSEMGKVSGVQPYGTPSSSFNDKLISLSLNYSQSGISLFQKTSRKFTILPPGQCLRNQNLFVKLDVDGVVTETKNIYTQGGCVGVDGIANGFEKGDDCCNSGEFCIEQGSSLPTCVSLSNSSNFTRCSDYKSVSSCDSDSYNVAINPSNPERTSDPQCGKLVNGMVVQCGSCIWDEEKPEGEECRLNKTMKTNSGSIIFSDDCSPASCSVGYRIEEACNGRYEIATITKTFLAGGLCGGEAVSAEDIGCIDEGPNQYLCGRPTIALPFFDYVQFVVVLIIVAGIYILTLRKNMRNAKKNLLNKL